MIPVKSKPYNANNIPSPPPTPTDYEAYVQLVNKYKEESDAQYNELKETKAEVTTTDSIYKFPNIGNKNYLYIDSSTNTTYRWDETELKYYCVGSDYREIEIIIGGKASDKYNS